MNAPAQQMTYAAALRMLAGTDFKAHSHRVGERDNWLSNILYSMGKGARLSKTTITKVEQAFPILPTLLQGGGSLPVSARWQTCDHHRQGQRRPQGEQDEGARIEHGHHGQARRAGRQAEPAAHRVGLQRSLVVSRYDDWLTERDPENQREREPDGEERERDPDDDAVDTAQDEARYERSRAQYAERLERAFGRSFTTEVES